MGDPGNVYITSSIATEGSDAADFQGGRVGIVVYSHWNGYSLPEDVRQAVAFGRGRWADSQYLTRILVDQLTKTSRDKPTGYGLGLSASNSLFPITVIDLGRLQVCFSGSGRMRDPLAWTNRLSFMDYITQEKAEYPS